MRPLRLTPFLRRLTPAGGFDRFFAGMVTLCLVAVWSIFGLLAYQTYLSQWNLASLSANNIAILLDHDVARNIEACDRALKSMLGQWADPQIRALPADTRLRILADQAANTKEIGSEMVIDAKGIVIADTSMQPRTGADLSDMSYFQAHSVGTKGNFLFISGPLVDGRSPKIALSRPITNPDGTFGGVVALTIGLDYFQSLFERIQLPPGSVLNLSDDEGRVLARTPYDPSYVGRHVTYMQEYLRIGQDSGEFLYRSTFDGARRLYVFRRVSKLPLVQSIGLSEDGINEQWLPGVIALALAFLVLSGFIITLAATLRRELKRRARAERDLIRLANTDALTGLANRRHFDDILDVEWRRAQRMQSPMALIIVDCDHFKSFNDAYGHVEGDRALVTVAEAITGAVGRPGDRAARIGGEEFAILLPSTPLSGALAVASRIRQAVIDKGLAHAASPSGVLTISAGAAAFCPEPGETAAELIRRADHALYEAKAKGRNMVRPANAKAA